jgi:type IV secretory pathway TrbF-like protein
VRWVETAYANGMRRSREEYTGLFQVKLIPPRDESDSFKNPIGVYITNFTWSREFSGAVMHDDNLRTTPSAPNNPDDGGMQ